MIYEMTIKRQPLTGPSSHTIRVEDSSTFEQLHQEILKAFQEEAPKNHSFQIVRSNGKKQSGVTIKQQPTSDQVAEDPFMYNEDSENTSLFEESSYEKDTSLKDFFKKPGDSATYISVQDVPTEYTITLNRTLSPAEALLAEFNRIMDLSPEKGEKYDDLKRQLDDLMQLLNPSSGKSKTPTAHTQPQIYSFKITLENVGVPVWRKVQVNSASTFLELHKIIQILFDWQEDHLHDFRVQKSNGVRQKNVIIESDEEASAPFDSLFFDDEQTYLSETEEHLHDHFLVEKDQARYTYDFGDDWQHKIVLEKILAPVEGTTYPICTAAKNDAPYEDSRYEVITGSLSLLNSNAKGIVTDVNGELRRRIHKKKISRKRK
ncbi:plasmid pRiA4b ORF-3 family protein [Trichococcus pasteurii]|uniref:Plasmid pria4b orf3 n=1 Tax=Trichococcus pasteurii TaxID=43064 RepID=A0A1W1IHQ7_9LACT|nr:plasmid pRiA4b ORF-3 family protein [Trichococcus pasteurii]SFE67504.1 pRiA4b ORF-3-like protein [Trichococcus pasteurii]SLM52520.1 plasmid pria4b orf3 [Trichococcus pasteurii]SSB93401.1 plasmid pria4b orf3 [Trichococcus pasteurii]